MLVYDGWYKEGKRHGQGTAYDANETLEYEGYFKEDLKHGYGKKYNEQGTISE